MKIITIMIIFLFITTSCSLVNFDYDVSSKGQIDKILICNLVTGIPDSFKNNLMSQLNDTLANSFDDITERVKKEDVWPAESIIVKKLSLEQTDIPSTTSSSNTLGIIETLKIYISLKDDTNKILLASVKNDNRKATELNFETSNDNIIDYIDKGFKLTIDVGIADCPSENIGFNNNMTVNINL